MFGTLKQMADADSNHFPSFMYSVLLKKQS